MDTKPAPVPVDPMEEAIAAERAFLEFELARVTAELEALSDARLIAVAARIAARQMATAQIPVQHIDRTAIVDIVKATPQATADVPATKPARPKKRNSAEERKKRRERDQRRRERLQAQQATQDPN